MSTFPSQSEMQRQIKELTALATAPQTLEALKTVSAAPENERTQLTEELVTPKKLAEAGAPIPEGLRISLRTFEAPTQRTLSEYTYDAATGHQASGSSANRYQVSDGTTISPQDSTTICASVGEIACVSVGHTTDDPPKKDQGPGQQ